MNRSVRCMLWALGTMLLLNSSVQGAERATGASVADGMLQIHLPREVTIEGRLLSLGQVSVVRGGGTMVAKAQKIAMGQFSVPGQKVVLDRPTILSRLASTGIPAAQVRLTGAETVTVRRQLKAIETDDFLDVGKQFLMQHPSARSVYEVTAVVQPKILFLPGKIDDMVLTPRFVRSSGRGYVTVQIQVVADGKTLGTRDIPFRLKYLRRRAVTAAAISEGATLTPENVKVEEITSDRPEPAGWKLPYGLIASRPLRANVEIRADMAGSAQPGVVIRRNETVVIRIERPGFMVTAVGTALQEARSGEFVKVRNADSNRIIVCKVNANGTVEPML